jgi:nicotinate-nucleotide adenylyltransferase
LTPLAILGGTFDPVHYGHLRLAADLNRALEPVEVRLVPAGDPPHRGPTRASAEDRIAMLRLALDEFPELRLDTREVTRGGKSYTVDTLTDLRREAPDRPILLVVGVDAFHGFPLWHRWKRLFDLAHVVVVPRPGVDFEQGLAPELAAQWHARKTDDPRILREREAGSIYLQPVSANPISSSRIRAALNGKRGKPVEIAGLLPASVLAYIEAKRLYGYLSPHAG